MNENLREGDFLEASKILFICEKCGKKLEESKKNISLEMKEWMKNHLSSIGLKKKFRPVLSSCLGVCPEKKITLLFLDREISVDKTYLFDPALKNEEKNEELFKKVLEDFL